MEEAIHVLRLTFWANAREPLGFLAVMAFVIGGIGYRVLHDRYPRLGIPLFLLTCVGGVGFGWTASDIHESVTALAPPAVASKGRASASVGELGPAPMPQGLADGPPVANGVERSRPRRATVAGGSPGAVADAAPADHRIGYRWIPERDVSEETRTRDHRCTASTTNSEACDRVALTATYRLRLRSGPSERLAAATLRCLEGPCAASRVNFTRLSSDGRTVEASFDVWDAPTHWRLNARVEKQRLAR
jgi:hypothetical protein